MKTRDIGLDCVRVTATFMVIFLHVAGAGFTTPGSDWGAVNLCDSLVRPCVPLFFMLSGALILPQGRDNIHKVWKRVVKVGLPLIAWSLILMVWFAASSPNWLHAPSIKLSIGQIFQAPVMTHLWFLYTLIGLYLFVPVLQAFFQTSDRSLQKLYLGASFIGASIVPFVADLTGVRILGIDLSFFPIYAAYMLLGANLSNLRLDAKWAAVFLSGAFVAGGCTALLTYWDTIRQGMPVETFYAYSSPAVVAGAVGFFVGLRNLELHHSPFWLRALNVLASLSFGAYILHPVVLYYVFKAGLAYNIGGAWLGIPLTSTIIFGLVSLVVAIIRMFKITRWLVPN